MQRGISPIVATVLLIAISVIAAVGIYYWVGGYATKQPTPSTPRTLTAYVVTCGDSSTYASTVMIANTSPPGTSSITGLSTNTTGSTGLSTSSGALIFNCGASSIGAGEQTACRVGCNSSSGTNCVSGANGTSFIQGSGTIEIYGTNVAGALITC
ncbi:MAG: hypothetical protein J7K68_00770 [Candidatus Diapherotrites archaeon]|nr:hypothetical protein [Candidatus Diapherotrites archaeon]